MRSKKMDTFERFEQRKREVAVEIAQTQEPFRKDLAEAHAIIREGRSFEYIRERIVPEGSGLDKLLSFVGLKSASQKKREEERSYTRESYSRGERVLYGVGDFFSRARDFLNDPARGGMLWSLVRPLVVASSIGLARNLIYRGTTKLMRLPLGLFKGRRRRAKV